MPFFSDQGLILFLFILLLTFFSTVEEEGGWTYASFWQSGPSSLWRPPPLPHFSCKSRQVSQTNAVQTLQANSVLETNHNQEAQTKTVKQASLNKTISVREVSLDKGRKRNRHCLNMGKSVFHTVSFEYSNIIQILISFTITMFKRRGAGGERGNWAPQGGKDSLAISSKVGHCFNIIEGRSRTSFQYP